MTKPVRIQLSRKAGFKLQEHSMALNGLPAVKVDRTTRWGNPWTADAFDDPAAEFKASIGTSMVPSAGEIMHHLRGKNLACWCKPSAKCHADVLLEIANHGPPA